VIGTLAVGAGNGTFRSRRKPTDAAFEYTRCLTASHISPACPVTIKRSRSRILVKIPCMVVAPGAQNTRVSSPSSTA